VIIFEFKLKKYGANQSKLHEDYLEMLFYYTKNILLFVDLKGLSTGKPNCNFWKSNLKLLFSVEF